MTSPDAIRPFTRMLLVQPGRPLREVTLTEGQSLVLGSDPAADVFVPSPHLARQHAGVQLGRKQLVLRDLGGANGIRNVEGARVRALKLTHGQGAWLGDVYLRFEDGRRGFPAEACPRAVIEIQASKLGAAPIRHHLTPGRTVIGSDGSLADLPVDDPYVSSRHLEFLLAPDGVHVADLGSRNGTLVNNEPVVHRRVREGDVVALSSSTSIRVEVDDSGEGDADAKSVPPVWFATIVLCVIMVVSTAILIVGSQPEPDTFRDTSVEVVAAARAVEDPPQGFRIARSRLQTIAQDPNFPRMKAWADAQETSRSLAIWERTYADLERLPPDPPAAQLREIALKMDPADPVSRERVIDLLGKQLRRKYIISLKATLDVYLAGDGSSLVLAAPGGSRQRQQDPIAWFQALKKAVDTPIAHQLWVDPALKKNAELLLRTANRTCEIWNGMPDQESRGIRELTEKIAEDARVYRKSDFERTVKERDRYRDIIRQAIDSLQEMENDLAFRLQAIADPQQALGDPRNQRRPSIRLRAALTDRYETPRNQIQKSLAFVQRMNALRIDAKWREIVQEIDKARRDAETGGADGSHVGEYLPGFFKGPDIQRFLDEAQEKQSELTRLESELAEIPNLLKEARIEFAEAPTREKALGAVQRIGALGARRKELLGNLRLADTALAAEFESGAHDSSADQHWFNASRDLERHLTSSEFLRYEKSRTTAERAQLGWKLYDDFMTKFGSSLAGGNIRFLIKPPRYLVPCMRDALYFYHDRAMVLRKRIRFKNDPPPPDERPGDGARLVLLCNRMRHLSEHLTKGCAGCFADSLDMNRIASIDELIRLVEERKHSRLQLLRGPASTNANERDTMAERIRFLAESREEISEGSSFYVEVAMLALTDLPQEVDGLGARGVGRDDPMMRTLRDCKQLVDVYRKQVDRTRSSANATQGASALVFDAAYDDLPLYSAEFFSTLADPEDPSAEAAPAQASGT